MTTGSDSVCTKRKSQAKEKENKETYKEQHGPSLGQDVFQSDFFQWNNPKTSKKKKSKEEEEKEKKPTCKGPQTLVKKRTSLLSNQAKAKKPGGRINQEQSPLFVTKESR